MAKLPKISTKTGDNGTTSLWSGERVPKNHPAIKCVCELDLFDSAIGLLYNHLNVDDDNVRNIYKTLELIQSRLVYLKGEISTHPREWGAFKKKNKFIRGADVNYLDTCCDDIKTHLERGGYVIKGWVKYGSGGTASAHADYVRGLCRKSEIAIYDLQDNLIDASISDPIKHYINRLSDYLYWVARSLEGIDNGN